MGFPGEITILLWFSYGFPMVINQRSHNVREHPERPSVFGQQARLHKYRKPDLSTAVWQD
jgi:hypothetical protein